MAALFRKLQLAGASCDQAVVSFYTNLFRKLKFFNSTAVQVKGLKLTEAMLSTDAKAAPPADGTEAKHRISNCKYLEYFADGVLLGKVIKKAAHNTLLWKSYSERTSAAGSSASGSLQTSYWFISRIFLDRLPAEVKSEFNAACCLYGCGQLASANVLLLNLLALAAALGDSSAAKLLLPKELVAEKVARWQPLAGQLDRTVLYTEAGFLRRLLTDWQLVDETIANFYKKAANQLKFFGQRPEYTVTVGGKSQPLKESMLAASVDTKLAREAQSCRVARGVYLAAFADGKLLADVVQLAAGRCGLADRLKHFSGASCKGKGGSLRSSYWAISRLFVLNLPQQQAAEFNAECCVYGAGGLADANVLALNLLALAAACGDAASAKLLLPDLHRKDKEPKWKPLRGWLTT